MEIFLPISGVEIMAWKLVLLGFTVGVIGGFFGVGGAFMVTPALNVFGFPMAYAIGTDMAHIAGKSIVATAKHRKYGNVDMRLGLLMIVGTAIGIEGGATAIMWLEKVGRVDYVVRITYMVLLFGLSGYMFYEYYSLTKGTATASKPVSDAGTSGLALKMQKLHIPPMIHLKVSGFYHIGMGDPDRFSIHRFSRGLFGGRRRLHQNAFSHVCHRLPDTSSGRHRPFRDRYYRGLRRIQLCVEAAG